MSFCTCVLRRNVPASKLKQGNLKILFVRQKNSSVDQSQRLLSSLSRCHLSRQGRTGERTHYTPVILTGHHQISAQVSHTWLGQSSRTLFWSVQTAFNKVDEERVKLAGPNRACAEWVLRNGGAIKWTSSGSHLKDFNLLPSTDFHNYNVEEIDLSGTDIMGLGFLHLKNLKHVKSVSIHGVKTCGDDALVHLEFVSDTLKYLDVSGCAMITEKGLTRLTQLTNLKQVTIYNMIEIKDLGGAVSKLKQAMPWCTFITKDPLSAQ